MNDFVIATGRLRLVAAIPAYLRADLDDGRGLDRLLGADVPAEWPPDLYDREAIETTLQHLERMPEESPWWMRYIVRADEEEVRTLIGIAALKGPVAPGGAVEIGYALLREFRGRGFATEAVKGLISWAFQCPDVNRIYAQTLPQLAASIRVLDRAGFTFLKNAEEDGMKTVKYELTRAMHVDDH